MRTDRQEQLETVLRTVATGARRALPGTSAVPMRTVSDVLVSALPTPATACPVSAEDRVTLEQVIVLETDPRCSRGRLPGEVGEDDQPLVDDGSALGVLTGSDVTAARNALAAGRVLVFPRQEAGVAGRPGPPKRSERHGGRPAAHNAGRLAGSGLPGHARPAEPPLVGPRSAGVRGGPGEAARGGALRPAHEPARLHGRGGARGGGRRRHRTGLPRRRARLPEQLRPGLVATTVAMVVIAFVGTVTAVGLALAEGRTEATAYAAVGASPGLRRRLAAAQAGVISVLGGLAGVAGGLLVGYVLANLSTEPVAAAGPAVGLRDELAKAWPYLAALALGPVLMALAASFVFTRTTLPLPRRVNQ